MWRILFYGIGIAALFGVGFLVGWYVDRPNGGQNSGQKNGPSRSNYVTALGRVQPEKGVLALPSPLPDTIAKLYPDIEVDAKIADGTPLVMLASHRDYQLKFQLAKKQLLEAEALEKATLANFTQQFELQRVQKEKAKEEIELNVTLLKSKVKLLEAKRRAAQSQLNKLRALPGFSQQELDKQNLLFEELEIQVTGARDELQQVTKSKKHSLDLLDTKKEATKALKDQSLKEIPIEVLKLQVKAAKAMRDKTIIKAPFRGEILKIVAHKGDLVGLQKPILYMADLSKMIVIAEVYRTEVPRVQKNDKAYVIVPGDKKVALSGTVIHKSRMGGKNQLLPQNPLQEVDRKIVEVTILLDGDNQGPQQVDLKGTTYKVNNRLAKRMIDHEVEVVIKTR